MKLTWKRVAVLLFLAVVCIFTLVGRIKFDSVVDDMMEKQIKKHMALENGTESFKNWVKPPIPVAFQIYLFDVVNHMEVQNRNATPVVVERGPYVYRMHMSKTDIKFHDNYTVQFRQPEMFLFDRDASVGPETDTVTTLNIMFYILANSLKNQSPFVQTAVNDFFQLQGENAFMTRSLKDIWWGYEDPALKDLADLLHRLHINTTVPDKFGFYLNALPDHVHLSSDPGAIQLIKNNSDGGLFNIFSGQSGDFCNFEIIDHWNGLRKLPYWTSDYANRIKGTDGSALPPPVKKHTNFTIFDGKMLRSLNLIYDGATNIEGVDAYRFRIPFSDFASAEENPNNAGFCTPDVRHCLPSGAINLSVTARGAPMALSLPHFVGGDPIYQKQVRGMSPSPEKHQPFFDYHPLTGVNLRLARRYQIVMHMKRMKHLPAFHNVPNAFLPVLWIDGTATIDSDTLHLFKTQMQDLLDNMVYVKAAMVGVVCLTVFLALCLILLWSWRDRKKLRASRDRRDVGGEDDDDERLLVPGQGGEINTSDGDVISHPQSVAT